MMLRILLQKLLEKNLKLSQVNLSPKGLSHQPLTQKNCKMAAETWAASQVGSSTTPEQDTYKVQYLQQQEKEDNQEQQSPKIVNNETLQQPREVYAVTVNEVCVSCNDNDMCLDLNILQTDKLLNLIGSNKKENINPKSYLSSKVLLPCLYNKSYSLFLQSKDDWTRATLTTASSGRYS